MNFFKKLRQKKAKDADETKEAVKEASNLDSSQDQKLLFKAAYGGQCGVCNFAKLVSTSKDSHFIMCSHPQLPKYQGQPVLNCNFVAFRKPFTD